MSGVDLGPAVLARRRFLQVGALGWSLPAWIGLQQATAGVGGGRRAKRCIVLFAWGGMSHIDTWDPKPDAGPEIRGEFSPISTSVPGVFFSEHLPRLATQAHRLTVVRSVHHLTAGHREAAYWNLTGHAPVQLTGPAVLPSAEDWPCLGAQVSKATEATRRATAQAALPGAVTLPHPCADRGLLNGQYGGFLGTRHAPIFLQPGAGRPYNGISSNAAVIDLSLPAGLDRPRIPPGAICWLRWSGKRTAACWPQAPTKQLRSSKR